MRRQKKGVDVDKPHGYGKIKIKKWLRRAERDATQQEVRATLDEISPNPDSRGHGILDRTLQD